MTIELFLPLGYAVEIGQVRALVLTIVRPKKSQKISLSSLLSRCSPLLRALLYSTISSTILSPIACKCTLLLHMGAYYTKVQDMRPFPQRQEDGISVSPGA